LGVALCFNNQLISPARQTASYWDLHTFSSPVPVAETPLPGPRLTSLLLEMMRRPQRILRFWNWKNAVLSVVLRGPIFLVAASRLGWKAALAALCVEIIFCVVTAGFYGAIVQNLKDAEPRWLTAIFLAGVIPFIFQVLEYLMHWLRGTPHLRAAAVVSLFAGAIAALFNWYAMRRGTLLVGREGAGFGRDLHRLPLLLLRFFAILPRKLAAYFRSRTVGTVGGE
jgi:hypothetical protein